jgi:hypothetical protein
MALFGLKRFKKFQFWQNLPEVLKLGKDLFDIRTMISDSPEIAWNSDPKIFL